MVQLGVEYNVNVLCERNGGGGPRDKDRLRWDVCGTIWTGSKIVPRACWD